MSEQRNDNGLGCTVMMLLALIIFTAFLVSRRIDKLEWELRDAQRRIAILENR